MKVYTEDQVRDAIKSRTTPRYDKNVRYWLNTDQVIKELTPIELPNDQSLNDKLFHLANEFAVAGYGKTAVLLHTIHNGFDINEQGGNK